MKQKLKLIGTPIFGLAFMAFGVYLIGHPVNATAITGWDPGNIMSDSVMGNKNSMTKSQIQAFLNSKNKCNKSVASANGEVIGESSTQAYWKSNKSIKYQITGGKKGTTQGTFRCLAKASFGGSSAADIIYSASRTYNINPQTLIVLLQKESGLITDLWPHSNQYRTAMGYGCPDNGPNNTANCSSNYYGFTNQVRLAASLFNEVLDGGWTNYPVGDNYIQYNPSASCGGKTVNIKNRATSALYRYTPYQPNSATLARSWPITSPYPNCGAYGNLNFYMLFKQWFGSSVINESSLLFKLSGSDTVYLEWGDHYYPIPSGDILKAYGLNGKIPRIVSDFPSGKTSGNTLSRSAKFGSNNPSDSDYTASVSLVDNGHYHVAPNWNALNAHGITTFITYPSDLKEVLGKGDALTKLVRNPDGTISLMEDNKSRIFPDSETYRNLSGSDYTGNISIYSTQALTNMSAYYSSTKEDGAPMLLSGKFLKASSSSTIYLYEDGQLYSFDGSSYKAWGRKLDYTFPGTTLSKLESSNKQVPVLIKSTSNNKYIADSGRKFNLSSDAQNSWGFEDDDFVEFSDRSLARLIAKPAPTLITSDGGKGVYKLINGKHRIIASSKDFSGLGYSWGSVENVTHYTKSLTKEGSPLFKPGTLIRETNGAVHLINSETGILTVPSTAAFNRFGFKWGNVLYLNSTLNLSDYTKLPLRPILKQSSDNSFFIIEQGLRHKVSSSLAQAAYYNLEAKPYSDTSQKAIDSIRKGKDLTKFLQGPGPTVYMISNGTKRPFSSSSSFYSHGGSWDKVIKVSNEFLAELPTGSSL